MNHAHTCGRGNLELIKQSPLYHMHGLGLKVIRECPYDVVGGIQITKPSETYPLLEDLLKGEEKEHFYSILLNTRSEIQGVDLVSVGSLNASLVHPREVFRLPVICAAASIIVAHNHPSGSPTPSSADIDLTERLVKAGEIMGIELLDHIVYGDPGHFMSLREGGVM